MAKLIETTPPPAPKPPRTFTLELNEDELVALRVILSRVGGDPWGSARKYTDQIYESLKNGNVASNAVHLVKKPTLDVVGVYFIDGLSEFNKFKTEALK